MYSYVGKLNYLKYAENDIFVLVVPKGFSLNDPILTYHQWTVDSKGITKGNVPFRGLINSVTDLKGEYKIGFFLDHYYTFEAVVPKDKKSLTVTMKNQLGASATSVLELHYTDEVLPHN